jgi:S-layer protein
LNLAKSDATFTANIVNTAFAAGASDTINLALSDSDGTVRNFGTVNAANVENFVITTSDGKTGADGTNPDAISLGTSTGKSITVSGTGGLDLTSTSTALTNVDASGITLGGFTWTSGALAGNVIVKGSVSGTNTVNLAADVAGTVGYTGGTGFDTVTLGASSKAHTINLGSGTTNNTVVGGSANGIVTVTSTAGTTSSVGVDTGTDTVTLGNGANIVSLGNGANIFTAGSGANTYTGGAGVDTVTVGAGANILTLGAGADVVTFSAAPAGVNSYSTITDAHKGMSIAVANLGTETIGTKISLASTAVFQDYANDVIAQGGNASVNGHWGYFTFTQTVNGVASTDTYLVQSRHDGTATTNPAFIAGTDFIVKLTGVVDLSAATGGDSNIIVLG